MRKHTIYPEVDYSNDTQYLSNNHTFKRYLHYYCSLHNIKIQNIINNVEIYIFRASLMFSSVAQSCPTLCDPMNRTQHTRPPCPSPTPRVHPNPCPSSWWCHPPNSSSDIPFSSCPQSFPVSGSFTNESALRIRWLKYWTFSFNISPSNEHWGLIFRMDWLDLLAVQGTLKSLLQHHISKASILLCSAFFVVQLSHSYMTTEKTI